MYINSSRHLFRGNKKFHLAGSRDCEIDGRTWGILISFLMLIIKAWKERVRVDCLFMISSNWVGLMSLIRHLVKATGNRQTLPSYRFTITSGKMSRDQTVILNLTDTLPVFCLMESQLLWRKKSKIFKNFSIFCTIAPDYKMFSAPSNTRNGVNAAKIA